MVQLLYFLLLYTFLIKKEGCTKALKYVKLPITIFMICLFVVIVIPTRTECYQIFGLGAALVQSNETAKQLPDKAVKALEVLLNNYIEHK